VVRSGAALLLCLLAACGGGGGGSEEAPAPATPLAIIEAPRVQHVGPGETAVFAVAARGSGAIGYQWFRNGVPIEGEVRPRLEVRVRAAAQGDRYSVRVTDASGTLTSEPVQYVLLEASAWQHWAAAPAGPIGLVSFGPDQFVFPSEQAFRFDLFLARPDSSAPAGQVVAQGNWDPMVQVRDWPGGLPGAEPRAAGPVRALAYAAHGQLWRLDLRVPPGQEAQPRMLSTQLSRQMCRVGSLLFQDRVDPMRSLLVYGLPQPEHGCYAPDTAQHRVVRLNHQPFEDPIDLPPRARPLFALHDTEGTITGLVMREAGGRVLRLDARDFRPQLALTLAAGAIETLVKPGPGQPWWVFSDGSRILSVQVDSPTPWTVQTLAAAGPAGAALPDLLGAARIDGHLSMLLWEPQVGGAAGGRLLACAVTGCPAGPRELLAPSLGYTSVVRLPDSEGSERAWFALGDRRPSSTVSSLTVAQLRGDGGVSVRLTEANGPQHQLQRGIVGLFGDWLLSRSNSAPSLGLPVAGALPERRLAPTGYFLPNLQATRADRFWFDWLSSAGILELRDAAGDLLQTVSGVIPAQFAVDGRGVGDELLVIRLGASGSSDLLGLDPVTGMVRTHYGAMPSLRAGPALFLDPPRTGQIVLFTMPSIVGIGRETLSAIRVGTPGVRLLVGFDS
jgi:hypothetical protein